MRTVTFGGASSLDHYLARPDGDVEWLMWCSEAADAMVDYWKSVDTVLMGRKTYEVAVRGGQGSGYPHMKNYVFSRTLREDPGPNVKLVREDAAAFVRRLKEEDGKGICVMGGGEFARCLFEADLIDEVGLNLHPVLLGAGVPTFHSMNRQIDLELRECRAFKNGCVYLTYMVKRSS
jgi:dihydrofolate reductase